MKYIATISGGKDSVTMCDLLLKKKNHIDYIVFTDTLLEFKLMYPYIEKVKAYFKSRYRVAEKKFIILKPNTTFEEWCFGTIKKDNAKRVGAIRGIPSSTEAGICYWRRESKIYPMERFVKTLNDEVTFYIGYTLDENRSIANTEKITYEYPLQNIFKMSERDCQQYLINQEMENPLYKYFSRTGCGVCPFQSDRAFFQIYKHFKEDWEYMKWIEARLEKYEAMGMTVINKNWFGGRRSILDVEKDFINAEKQDSLFDFSDEPLKDCFCKI